MRVESEQVVTIGFRVKNSIGELVDADATPTAALYLNGVATAVSVTVSSVTGAGKYKASWTNGTYNAGDQLRLEVTATVEGASYSAFVWEATVDQVAATAADMSNAQSQIIAHGDTAWPTATGFAVAGDAMALTSGERSTLSSAIEAALLNDSDGQALVDAIITRIETDLDAGDTSVAAIAVATRDAILDRVLATNHDIVGSVGKLFQDTYSAANNLDARATEARLAKLDSDLAEASDIASAQSAIIAHGDLNWTGVDSGPGFTVNDIAAAILQTPANKIVTDAAGNVSISQSFPTNFDALAITVGGHVGRVVLVDTTTTNSDLAAAVDEITGHGDANWAPAVAPGDTVVEVTVTDDTAVVVQAARVNIYGADGAPLGIFAYTGASGIATFQLADGDYLAGIGSISGFNAHTPQAFTVSAAGIVSGKIPVALAIERTTPVTPDDPALCLVKCYITDAGGQAVEGISISATPKSRSLTVPSKIITLIAATAETDAAGYAELLLPRADAIDSEGSKAYRFQIRNNGMGIYDLIEKEIPNTGETTLDVIVNS